MDGREPRVGTRRRRVDRAGPSAADRGARCGDDGRGVLPPGTEHARRAPGRDRAGGLPRRRRAPRRRDRARSSRTRGRAGLRTHPPVEQPRVRRRRDRLRRAVRGRGHRPGAAHVRRRHGNARSLVDDDDARCARARAERRALRLRRGGVPRLASSRAAARRHAPVGDRIRRGVELPPAQDRRPRRRSLPGRHRRGVRGVHRGPGDAQEQVVHGTLQPSRCVRPGVCDLRERVRRLGVREGPGRDRRPERLRRCRLRAPVRERCHGRREARPEAPAGDRPEHDADGGAGTRAGARGIDRRCHLRAIRPADAVPRRGGQHAPRRDGDLVHAVAARVLGAERRASGEPATRSGCPQASPRRAPR